MTAVEAPELLVDDRSMAQKLIEPLALLPEAEREAMLAEAVAGLSDQDLEVLLSWVGQGRPSQRVDPTGDALLVALMGGRGAGKSRAGSEAFCDRIEADMMHRGAFVSRTPGDVRRVMIEGPGGFLAAAERRGIRAVHTPSRTEIKIVDGGVINTFTAHSPESIRGNEFDTAWCLPAGTMVATPRGSTPIEHVRVGAVVLTRDGLGTVRASGMTRRQAELVEVAHTTGTFRCTPDHQVWTDTRGWVRADDLLPGDTLRGCASHLSNAPARAAGPPSPSRPPGSVVVVAAGALAPAATASWTSSSGAANAGTGTTPQDTPLATESTGAANYSTGRSTSTTTVPSLSATTSTTSTATRPTTTRRTWWPWRRRSTMGSTAPEGSQRGRLSSAATPSEPHGAPRHQRSGRASTATPRSSRPASGPSTAALPAASPTVVVVHHLADRADTYDLSIDGRPEFFADGILVHNCDEFAAWPTKVDELGGTAFSNLVLALRFGQHPLGIFTTTPRATPAVKQIMNDRSGLWRIARMSTMANASNLAPGFIPQLMRMFGGSRLFAQEVLGLYVEDVEGALWSTARIEGSRLHPGDHHVNPELDWGTYLAGLATETDRLQAKIALAEQVSGGMPWRYVAVDPSFADDGGGDECGIVVGGVGLDGRFYVFGDYSGHMSMEGWAQRVSWAYHTAGCSYAVVEGNMAQSSVATTIANVDPTIPIEWVHARQGKRARAEPVSVLWKEDPAQSIGVFVGSMPGLEAECTGWDARSNVSPNRIDALAWLGWKCFDHLFTSDGGWSAGWGAGQPLPL